MINSRVRIGSFGPFDCMVDPEHRWNGWLNPFFTLDVARVLALQTVSAVERYGYGCPDTVHVIEGCVDSADTVHVIRGGVDSEGDPQAVTVRIRWSQLDRDGGKAVTITPRIDGEPTAGGSGRDDAEQNRAVALHIDWPYIGEEPDSAVQVICPNDDGLFGIGGFQWVWSFASWWCLCGGGFEWHETACDGCGLSREQGVALGETARKVGEILYRAAPDATAVRFESIDGVPCIVAVLAGDPEVGAELSTGDDGPFDAETLGEADALLRAELDGSKSPSGLMTFPTD